MLWHCLLCSCGLHAAGPVWHPGQVLLRSPSAHVSPSTHVCSPQGLPGILAKCVGRDIESIYAGNNRGELAEVSLLQSITGATRELVTEFVKDRTGIDGRIGTPFL